MGKKKIVVVKPKTESHLNDSGHRVIHETGGVREQKPGKGRFDLLPFYAMFRLAKHFENGTIKYGDRNWEKGLPLHTFIDSLVRHTAQLMAGDTSEDHAAAMAWNAMALIETQHRIEIGLLPKELDDLPKNNTWSDNNVVQPKTKRKSNRRNRSKRKNHIRR